MRATDVSQNATALWVGDGENLVKLAEFGQLIDTDLGPIPLGYDFGAQGKQVVNGVIDINDAGQVAFAAFLENGTIGVFVATPKAPSCPADLTGDGVVDIFDLLAYLDLYTVQDPGADLSEPFGTVDLFDLLEFADLYQAGCP